MTKWISSHTGPLNVLKSRKDWYTNTPCRAILWYSELVNSAGKTNQTTNELYAESCSSAHSPVMTLLVLWLGATSLYIFIVCVCVLALAQ